MSSSSARDIIKDTVYGFLSNPEIILFGSRARGDDQLLSDYDLLIILEHPIDIPTRLKYQSIIRKRLAEKDIMSDVIVQSYADVKIKKTFRVILLDLLSWKESGYE